MKFGKWLGYYWPIKGLWHLWFVRTVTDFLRKCASCVESLDESSQFFGKNFLSVCNIICFYVDMWKLKSDMEDKLGIGEGFVSLNRYRKKVNRFRVQGWSDLSMERIMILLTFDVCFSFMESTVLLFLLS